MSWLLHDSQDTFFRDPFGAVPCGTVIILRLKVCSDEAPESVHVRLWENNKEINKEMRLADDAGREKIYQAEVTASKEPGLIWYYFFAVRHGRVYYYGNNPYRLGGKGLLQEHIPPSYQITVYREGYSVPAWFKKTVMYQIYVDRFFNGNEDGRVSNPPKGSLVHASWEDTPLYVRDPRNNGILRWTFFGGNLPGVIAKLPYLKELGIGVIYFNPVFESSSNHKYDTGDYKKIDPMFGTNETFRQLCKKAGQMGIRIILDGVFSHTGSDSIYFNREGSYPGEGAYQSRESPYYRWFKFIDYPDVYESWWGIGTLPNVNEMEPTYQDFIINDDDSVVKYWMKMGAKGWRLDVADELPDEFIRKLRLAMKKQDPDSILIGEVWEDASHKVSYGHNRAFLWGEALDTVMNYPFRKIMLDFILGRKDARQVNMSLMSLYENYPKDAFYSAMNLIGSHDVPRVLTILGEGPPEEGLAEVERGEATLLPVQRKLGLRRLKLLALIQMTFPGVPAIYYGDEAGMEGYSDPFNRAPYPWAREEQNLLEWYKKIIALKNKHPALQDGEWMPLYAKGDVYAYLRQKDSEKAAAFFNRNIKDEARITVDLRPFGKGIWRDVLNAAEFRVEESQEIVLAPLEGKVLIKA